MAILSAAPTKLRDGSWGARVQGTARVGDLIQISTRAGKRWTATVERVVWSGQGASIVATESIGGRARVGPGRRTGCSCGSREDASGELIPSLSNCASCNFDAYDC